MIDGRNFWLTNNKWQITNESIKKIATGHGDIYKIGCLLDTPYFRDNYKITTTDLSKHQALDADLKAIY